MRTALMTCIRHAWLYVHDTHATLIRQVIFRHFKRACLVRLDPPTFRGDCIAFSGWVTSFNCDGEFRPELPQCISVSTLYWRRRVRRCTRIKPGSWKIMVVPASWKFARNINNLCHIPTDSYMSVCGRPLISFNAKLLCKIGAFN